MKKFSIVWALLGILLFISCSNDDDQGTTNQNPDPDPDPIVNDDVEIDDFIYKGMNFWYLYKEDVPDLANDRFSNNEEYAKFLAGFESPEKLFDDGLVANQDRFSFLVDDYVELERSFSGISKSNGMDFQLVAISNSNDIFGYVRYVLPGTDAEAKGVSRGDIFISINGEQLTRSNFRELLFGPDSYEVGFATIENGTIIPSNGTLNLTKVEYTENPLLISKVIEYEGKRIGYLMYNSFIADFNKQLNDAFGQFKDDNIEELVLDLRYNPGGRVSTAIGLAGMITGQFTGEVFLKQTWNAELQAQFTAGQDGEEALIDRFTDRISISDVATEPLNSLNLSKLHVLTTDGTASASELIINSLSPYIDVVQIGTTTTGKFQASATFYDAVNPTAPNPVTFVRDDELNPNHTYAIQPLIYKSENKNGEGDFIDGLLPDVVFEEDITNLGTLGEVDEPLLKVALDFIADGTLPTKSKSDFSYESIGETKMFEPTYQRMYIDNFDLPDLLK